jgi:hypothetical protein
LNEVEQLLREAEADVTLGSDECMRLMVEFGNDSVLQGFVAESNQFKADIKLLQVQLRRLKQEIPSVERNAKLQIFLAQVKATRLSAGRFKERVMEISRND